MVRFWSVIADGGMRANCNRSGSMVSKRLVIADGGMRANCNSPYVEKMLLQVIADGGMRANCNTAAPINHFVEL